MENNNNNQNCLDNNTAQLTVTEQKALNEFLDIVNKSRIQNAEKQMRPRTAVKFLMARKFDVARSLQLYQSHETVRIREGLVKFDPLTNPLKQELETGKFTILRPVPADAHVSGGNGTGGGNRSSNTNHNSSGGTSSSSSGSMIALFSAGKHIPTETTHQITLQGMVYQLDVALDDYATQRSGIIFIYNMTGSKYANFDYELSQKILSLLKGAYPARLKKVLIVTAPLWFKAPFRILQLFVREKLRDRVHMVTGSQLFAHVPREHLPEELGGTYQVDHRSWLEHCLSVHQHDMGDLCPSVPADRKLFSTAMSSAFGVSGGGCGTTCSSPVPSSAGSSVNSSPVNTIKKNNLSIGGSGGGGGGGGEKKNGELTINCNIVNNTVAMLLSNGDRQSVGSSGSSGIDTNSIGLSIEPDLERYDGEIEDDVEGITLQEFFEQMQVKGRRGLQEEYYVIKMTPPTGTFEIARTKMNQYKNRYIDVLCYDHSRVKLPTFGDNESDYINANYVDGYRQKRAFISTQGPLTKTFNDFWRCVWYNKTVVIVMTTRTVERCRAKCDQYWPLDEKTYFEIGNFCIINNHVEQQPDWIISELELRNRETGESRTVMHMLFTSWPDFGVPQSAIAMLDFRQKVRDYQSQYTKWIKWKGHPLGPPIIVHCSAGIGRTGTFITIDISIQRLESRGRVDIKRTVERIRSQRAYSIQMPDQYIFCNTALMEFAICKGLLENIDLSRFEEDEQSDGDD